MKSNSTDKGWEKRFDKFKHEPDYPVVGGHPQCANCGEQAYETEYCSINIDWVMEEIKSFISDLLEEERKRTLNEAIKIFEPLKEGPLIGNAVILELRAMRDHIK